MKYLLPLLLVILCMHSRAQNILINGNFEQYITCPGGGGLNAHCFNWREYTIGTNTGLFHGCSSTSGVPTNSYGYQAAASGVAYIKLEAYQTPAFINSHRDYVATSFPPLTPGRTYEISMSASLVEIVNYGATGLGVHFYDNGPSTLNISGVVPVTPKVSYSSYGPLTNKTGWDRVSAQFVADSAYDNLVIGSFLTNTAATATYVGGAINDHAIYYIDSVVLEPMDPIWVDFTDSLVCGTDSFMVPYTAKNGLFNSGNVFTVQLSNASGSFAIPVNIGSKATTTSGSIKVGLPSTLLPGTGYRIRIGSTNAPFVSLPTMQNITIGMTATAKPVITSTNPACAGSTLNLSATSSGTITSWSWKGPNGFSATIPNPSISNPVPAVADTYIVKAYSYGCVASDTEIVTVYAVPAPPVVTSNSPVCPGTPINLTANNIAGATYSWSGPSSFVSTQQNPVISNAAATHAGIYSVTATVNGCTSPAATISVVVATPSATYTAGSNSPVCAGGTLDLNVSNIPGAIFNWSGPNGFSATTQNPSIVPVPLNASGTYSVYATVNGCQYPAVTTTVVVNNVSSLGVYPSPNDTLCINNANANFVAVPFNAGTAPQYQWYKNNSLIGGAASISYPASGIADGDSFYCRMTVTGLCADPLILYSNKVGMTVLPLTAGPTVSITADPGTLLSPWQLVKFTAVATNASVLPKYQWKRNGQDVIGATSNVWSANNLSNGDTISCVVTSGVWCASPASEMSNRMAVNIKTGISDIDADRKLELYPNPNNGSFVVNIPRLPFQGGNLRVDVVDALGRTVYSSQLQVVDNRLEVALPASVANGVYMLKLGADGVVYHARFTVSR